jgi:Ca-activated chloride channel family protein
MKSKLAYLFVLAVIMLSTCAKQQLTTTTFVLNQEEQKSNPPLNVKTYIFDNAGVMGYLDNPTPVYNIAQKDLQVPPPSTFARYAPAHDFATEEYNRIYENSFLDCVENPVSTFSIDVDVASYANTRRFLNDNKLPPHDAVRIEEFINYFNYHYPPPADSLPFSLHTEVTDCPWKSGNKILKIGIKGREIEMRKLPPRNLVFLLDVSGSMDQYNKLPLLKKAFRLLVNALEAHDKVAIVVYAGAAGLVLPPTSGNKKETILNAIDELQAGGTTAGGQGIELAYKIAKEHFLANGSNRVILATDGDFNVGVSSDAELVRMIENKREQGIFLTILGFGGGNYKDSKMEQLADKGNGNYAYIDNILEAQKVLVNEIGGTLHTIARDVKLQLEFNPLHVRSYRLIGYENRMLSKEDFEDDKKDAGELGAGHTVTALYEVTPSDTTYKKRNALRYQETQLKDAKSSQGELGFLKLRYKQPTDSISTLIETPITDRAIKFEDSPDDLRFACAVASFGMILRGSEYKGIANYGFVEELAKTALGNDTEGYRKEFIKLVQKAKLLQEKNSEDRPR